ncbi:MAG TPA: acyl-CoA thioesterase [Solirubrobacteraceae bacterium]|jgi:acyl-CoA hydrolase
MTLVVRRMLPSHANPAGAVFGGEILKACDEAAGIAAGRHARRRVVTAAVDAMEFVEPARIGEVLTCKATVNAVFGSSMEVGVRVEAEDLLTGDVRHTNSAYFVMVALDDDGSPVDVGDVEPSTDDERRRHAEARERQARRKGDA